MELDLPTVSFVSTLASALTAVSILVVSSDYDRDVRRYLRLFALSMLSMALAWTLFSMRSAIGVGLSILASSTLFYAGAVCQLWAIRDFLRLRVVRPTELVAFVALPVIFAMLIWGYPNLTLRVIFFTLFVAPVLAATILALRRHAPRPVPKPFLLLATSLAVVLGLLVVRGIAQLTIAPAEAAMGPTTPQTLLYLFANLMAPLTALGFVLMVNERLRNSLHALAVSDPLTGLANRRQLDERAARWEPPHGPGFAALVIDADHFKRVNDLYGHAVGDEVLVSMAKRIAAHAEGADLAVRLGGEEFALVLPGTGIRQALLRAERLRADIAGERLSSSEEGLRVTVSVGVACSGPGREGLAAVLREADMALYAAKAAGRNRVMPSAS